MDDIQNKKIDNSTEDNETALHFIFSLRQLIETYEHYLANPNSTNINIEELKKIILDGIDLSLKIQLCEQSMTISEDNQKILYTFKSDMFQSTESTNADKIAAYIGWFSSFFKANVRS